MTNPSQKRLEGIITDSIANEAADRAAWEANVAREDLTQAVDKALREGTLAGPLSTRQLAKLALEAVDRFHADRAQ